MSRTFADTLRSCSISALRFPVLARVVVLRSWCVGTSKSALPHRAGATFLSLEQPDASPHPLQEALEPPNAQVCPAPPLSHLWMTGTTHNTDGTQQSWRDRSAEHASKKPPRKNVQHHRSLSHSLLSFFSLRIHIWRARRRAQRVERSEKERAKKGVPTHPTHTTTRILHRGSPSRRLKRMEEFLQLHP